MDSRDFAESIAFERLEPDPAEMTMVLVGQLLTLMANRYRDEKRRPRPYALEDFLPHLKQESRRNSPEQEQVIVNDARRRLMQAYYERKQGKPN